MLRGVVGAAQLAGEQEREGAVTEEAEAVLQEGRATLHHLQKDLKALAEEAAGLTAAQKTALKVKKRSLTAHTCMTQLLSKLLQGLPIS